MTFASVDGQGRPRDAHALYYPPAGAHTAPEGELPPLLVVIHGGPTGQASPVPALGLQYWTSRGFGVVDVDYGGSTGYGRAYREQLQGAWGIVDVADCLAAARALADEGWRMWIPDNTGADVEIGGQLVRRYSLRRWVGPGPEPDGAWVGPPPRLAQVR